ATKSGTAAAGDGNSPIPTTAGTILQCTTAGNGPAVGRATKSGAAGDSAKILDAQEGFSASIAEIIMKIDWNCV
ncbi:MAG: hypothetical protein LBL32_03395, partial [Holosporales bacterium]|nr:hypothetical protein [Holosporales bacterium]